MLYSSVLIFFISLLLRHASGSLSHVSNLTNADLLPRTFNSSIPSACQKECQGVIKAQGSNCNLACQCTDEVQQSLTICEECMLEIARDQEVKDANGAFQRRSESDADLPTPAQFEENCASAGFPLASTGVSSSGSSSSLNPNTDHKTGSALIPESNSPSNQDLQSGTSSASSKHAVGDHWWGWPMSGIGSALLLHVFL
ncbi:hypothetical protein CPB84DRAFT_1767783 [Gymnopilus junonius]|uniref:Uncharacterized protein n=1 Tax=Gymnopilus junonius TaxID=109634 RepID=A0A9P5NST2_GYMJU|nr:hypothetical protein CPB84DRAFT_1767783 [Gymnopilus junonius]